MEATGANDDAFFLPLRPASMGNDGRWNSAVNGRCGFKVEVIAQEGAGKRVSKVS